MVDHSDVVRPRVSRLLGKGLGWVEGESEHKRMRHLVSPSLSYVLYASPLLHRHSDSNLRAVNIKSMSDDIRLAANQVCPSNMCITSLL